MAKEPALYDKIVSSVQHNEDIYTLLDIIAAFYEDNKDNKSLNQLTSFKTLAMHLKVGHKKTTLKDKARLIALFYTDEKLLRFYYEGHTAQGKAFIELLTWEEVASYESARQIYKKDLLKVDPKANGGLLLLSEFGYLAPFITFEYGNYNAYYNKTLEDIIANRKPGFYFPDYIRLAYMAILDKPAGSHLKAITLPSNWKVYQFEEAIFKELPLIISSLQQEVIKKNQKGLLNLPSVKATQKRLDLHSFPNDGGYIKALMLASFVKMPVDNKIPAITPSLLKDMFMETSVVRFGMLESLIFPYKGLRANHPCSYYTSAYNQLREIVLALPLNGWVTLDNIQQYARFKYLKLDVLGSDSISPLKPNFAGLSALTFLQGSYYIRKKMIRTQTVTSIFLLAACLGFVDLAYDPADSTLYGDSPKDVTEGLFSACRMTALGAHVLLGEKEYKLPDTAVATTYTLDPSGKTLKVTGNFDLIAERLKEWTSDAADNHLKLDLDKILRASGTQKALMACIKRLKETLEIPVPDAWKKQLMKLVNNSFQVRPLALAKVYKLSPYDKQLQKLVAQDEVLRKITLKAQDFTLIVEDDNELTFLNRMAALGYVMEFPIYSQIKTMPFNDEATTPEHLRGNFDATFK